MLPRVVPNYLRELYMTQSFFMAPPPQHGPKSMRGGGAVLWYIRVVRRARTYMT